MVAVPLPEAGHLVVAELEPAHPFRALPEVQVGHQQSGGPAVHRIERLAVVFVGDPGLAAGEVRQRDVGGVPAVAEGERVVRAVSTPSSSVSSETPVQAVPALTTSSRSGCRPSRSRSAAPAADPTSRRSACRAPAEREGPVREPDVRCRTRRQHREIVGDVLPGWHPRRVRVRAGPSVKSPRESHQTLPPLVDRARRRSGLRSRRGRYPAVSCAAASTHPTTIHPTTGRVCQTIATCQPRLNWARQLGQQAWAGEPFTLLLDSHHRFVPAWDDLLLGMHARLRRAGIPKPLLTACLPAYDPAATRRAGSGTPPGCVPPGAKQACSPGWLGIPCRTGDRSTDRCPPRSCPCTWCSQQANSLTDGCGANVEHASDLNEPEHA